MKVAAYIHFSVPKKNAGSEVMLHRMLVELVRSGHQVRCFVTDNPDPVDGIYSLDGVEVYELSHAQSHTAVMRWRPDVVVTHHNRSPEACQLARRLRVPWVTLVHNPHPFYRNLIQTWNPALTVFNTQWISDRFALRDRHSIVVHPPIEPRLHRTAPGDLVTLVNPIPRKGSDVLYALAERLPGTKFLAVEGAYGKQDLRDLPNVEVVRHTTDMRADVWSRTKVLLIPSVEETYGMVGLEAAASGIPAVAAPTDGLRESLGEAGIFVPREDVDGWVRNVELLTTDTDAYTQASAAAKRRSRKMNTVAVDMKQWVSEVESVVSSY